MRVLAEMILAKTIETGSVYYFTEPTFGKEPHYFVVLNHDPLSSIRLIFACATSQLDKKRAYVKYAHLPIETLVEVDPSECPLFDKQTVFNCNSLHIKSIEEFLDKIRSGFYKHKGKLPPTILIKIYEAIEISPVISEDIKIDLRG